MQDIALVFQYITDKTVIKKMLQFHDNLSPVQRIIATRVEHECTCTGKLEAFIAAAGDHHRTHSRQVTLPDLTAL